MSSAGQREAENAIRFMREQIDAIDLQLVALLVQRARLAERIGEVKEYAELPIVEPAREQAVLSRAERLSSPPLDPLAVREIFSAIMLTMRRLQARNRDAGTAVNVNEAIPPAAPGRPAKKAHAVAAGKRAAKKR